MGTRIWIISYLLSKRKKGGGAELSAREQFIQGALAKKYSLQEAEAMADKHGLE